MIELLPHVNAALNATAAMCLVAGWWFIRRGQEAIHRRLMLTAFGVSILFLISYLTYHVGIGGTRRFPTDVWPGIRVMYLSILSTHTVLAATVPFLALITLYLGLTNRRLAHRRWARWTWPIWVYVSITGVVIYWMLYHAYAR